MHLGSHQIVSQPLEHSLRSRLGFVKVFNAVPVVLSLMGVATKEKGEANRKVMFNRLEMEKR